MRVSSLPLVSASLSHWRLPVKGRALSEAGELAQDALALSESRQQVRPLRDSADWPSWRTTYESLLGLEPSVLKARRSLLVEGGPEMLYRMYPHQFQEDLRGPYLEMAQLLPRAGPILTLAGDCHLGNFGAVLHQEQGKSKVLWGLNDFDQTGKGRVESDLCRTGASLALMAQERGWDEEDAQALVVAFARSYFKGLSQEPVKTQGLSKEEVGQPLADLVYKASRRTQEELLSKWAEPTADGFAFRFGERLQPLDSSQETHLEGLLAGAKLPRGTRILDRGIRNDGGGSSYGLPRYYLLAQSESSNLPVILEVKQVLPSALESSSPEPAGANAVTLEAGFRRLGAARDPWQRILKDDRGVYLMRERQRCKDAVNLDKLDLEEAREVAKSAGRVLAQAHAISGGAQKISGWADGQEKELRRNLSRFSLTYAAQVAGDFAAISRE